MILQVSAAVLAWELRRRACVALSVRAACELAGHPEPATRVIVAGLAACLPIVEQPTGWLRGASRPHARPADPLQRAGVLAWTLYDTPLTVRQAAQLTGLARNSAYTLLVRISAVVPIRDIPCRASPRDFARVYPLPHCDYPGKYIPGPAIWRADTGDC